MMNEPSSHDTSNPPGAPGGNAPRSCTRCGAVLATDGPCGACILQGARSSGLGAGAFTARSIEQMNDALPAYEFQVLVGQGGMGAVYRARHKKLDRLVAIKVLRPIAAEEDSASFAERFEREARVLAKLDHPHIVRIYDFGRTEDGQDAKGFFYLVLEFVDGASLRDLMVGGRLTAKEVLELIPQACEALQTAHGLGVIHRDIKPENILVDAEGRVRIADFGLAKINDAEPTGFGLTHTHQTFGTLHYMAPEQMRGAGNVDHRADLYSLGVVLYEMLTGELPLGRFVAPSEKAGGAKDLDGVVFRALENEPDARYQAAHELKRDLVAGANVSPVLSKRQRRARGIGRTTRRRSGSSSVALEPADSPTPKGASKAIPGPAPTPTQGATAAPKAGPEPGPTASVAEPAASLARVSPTSHSPRRSARATATGVDPVLRSWLTAAVLLATYGMFWAEFGLEDVARSLGSTQPSLGEGFGLSVPGELGLRSWQVMHVRPFGMNVNGIPLWLGLMTSIAAVVLRTMIAGGRALDGRIPTALAFFGFLLMAVSLVTFAVIQQLSCLRMGFALAFFVHGWAAFSELATYRNSRSKSS